MSLQLLALRTFVISNMEPLLDRKKRLFFYEGPMADLFRGFFGWPAEDAIRCLKKRLVDLESAQHPNIAISVLESKVDEGIEDAIKSMNEVIIARSTPWSPSTKVLDVAVQSTVKTSGEIIEVPDSASATKDEEMKEPDVIREEALQEETLSTEDIKKTSGEIIEVPDSAPATKDEEMKEPDLNREDPGYEALVKTNLLFNRAAKRGRVNGKLHNCQVKPSCTTNVWFLESTKSKAFSFTTSKLRMKRAVEDWYDSAKKSNKNTVKEEMLNDGILRTKTSSLTYINEQSTETLQLILEEVYVKRIKHRLNNLAPTCIDCLMREDLSKWTLLRWQFNSCAIDATVAVLPSAFRFCNEKKLFPVSPHNVHSAAQSPCGRILTLLHFCDSVETSSRMRLVLQDLINFEEKKLSWTWSAHRSQKFLVINDVFTDIFRYSFGTAFKGGYFPKISSLKDSSNIAEWLSKSSKGNGRGIYFVYMPPFEGKKKLFEHLLDLLGGSWSSEGDGARSELLGIISMDKSKTHFLAIIKDNLNFFLCDGLEKDGKMTPCSPVDMYSKKDMVLPGSLMVFGDSAV